MNERLFGTDGVRGTANIPPMTPETALALGITELVRPGILTLPQLIDRMSCAPARVFNLQGGTLRPGSVADVTVFDPEARWKVDPERFRSKSRNTPFAGWEVFGKVVMTIVGGRVVFRCGSD